MKKILITYASYGNGHKKIAEYIKNYIDEGKQYEIKMLDVLQYTGKMCNFSVRLHNYIYDHHFERLFTAMYQSTDNKPFVAIYNRLFKKIILNKRLKREFLDFNPDLVISSHFYGSNIANHLNEKGYLKSKIMTIVTDYKIHNFWMSNNNKDEIFIVANDIVKSEMFNKKCVSKNIYSYGLPFNVTLFNAQIDKEKICKKYDIDENKKVILFFGGGGNGNLTSIKYFKELLKLKLNVEIIFISGKSKEVEYEALKLKRKYNANNVHILGFINNIYELMGLCDIVISKPGGATITECLETEKVMLLLPGMGGQEKYNSKFVCKNNYGIAIRFLFTFKRNILNLVNNDKEYQKYKNSYKNHDKNKSLEQISNLIKKILK